MSETQQRAAAMRRVTEARTALTRLFTAAAERPLVGPVAEAGHVEQLIKAWAEFGEACRAAAQCFRNPSPPFVDLITQAGNAAKQVTRLRVDLAGKQAEVAKRLARVRGER